MTDGTNKLFKVITDLLPANSLDRSKLEALLGKAEDIINDAIANPSDRNVDKELLNRVKDITLATSHHYIGPIVENLQELITQLQSPYETDYKEHLEALSHRLMKLASYMDRDPEFDPQIKDYYQTLLRINDLGLQVGMYGAARADSLYGVAYTLLRKQIPWKEGKTFSNFPHLWNPIQELRDMERRKQAEMPSTELISSVAEYAQVSESILIELASLYLHANGLAHDLRSNSKREE